MGRLATDLTGRVFDRVTVLKVTDERSKDNKLLWECICECGTVFKANGHNLVGKHIHSCGCMHRESAKKNGIKGTEVVTLPFGESAFNKHYSQYKRDAEKINRVFVITKEQFRSIVNQNCYYCGSEPRPLRKSGRGNGTCVVNGIDRVDSSLGYILSNCVPCCTRCNRSKRDFTQEDFLDMVYRIYNNRILSLQFVEGFDHG